MILQINSDTYSKKYNSIYLKRISNRNSFEIYSYDDYIDPEFYWYICKKCQYVSDVYSFKSDVLHDYGDHINLCPMFSDDN